MMGEVSENSWQYFENNCMSVEILKNGFIQKLTFRVKNKVNQFDIRMDSNTCGKTLQGIC